MTVKTIDKYYEIMFYFPPEARHFAEKEAAHDGVFCVYINGTPAGLLCINHRLWNSEIVYLYVNEEFRKQGVGKALLSKALTVAKDRNASLYLRILQNSDYADIFKKMAEDINMKPSHEGVLLRLDMNEQFIKEWREFCEKSKPLLEKMEKRYGKQEVVSFAGAGKDVLIKLRKKIGNEFTHHDPFCVPDLDRDFSFIVMRDGEPVAFNAIRTIGDKMIYEISSAQKDGKSSVIPAVLAFGNKLCQSDVKCVFCLVNDGNKLGMNHVVNRYSFAFKESNRQITYIKDFRSTIKSP